MYKRREKYILNALRKLLYTPTPYRPVEPVKIEDKTLNPETLRKYAKEVSKWCIEKSYTDCPVKLRYEKGPGGRHLVIEIDKERVRHLIDVLETDLRNSGDDPIRDRIKDRVRRRRNATIDYILDMIADPNIARPCVENGTIYSVGCATILAILDAVTTPLEGDVDLVDIFIKKYNKSRKYVETVNKARQYVLEKLSKPSI